jgi:hypothetical protein
MTACGAVTTVLPASECLWLTIAFDSPHATTEDASSAQAAPGYMVTSSMRIASNAH